MVVLNEFSQFNSLYLGSFRLLLLVDPVVVLDVVFVSLDNTHVPCRKKHLPNELLTLFLALLFLLFV